MNDAVARVTDEFLRLDDELAAAVTLPSVDEVIRRTSTLNRASTAAAAAVLTVGTLGGITVMAQAGPEVSTAGSAELAPPVTTSPEAVAGPPSAPAAATTDPTTTRVPPAPKVEKEQEPQVRPRERERVEEVPTSAPAVVSTTRRPAAPPPPPPPPPPVEELPDLTPTEEPTEPPTEDPGDEDVPGLPSPTLPAAPGGTLVPVTSVPGLSLR